jgi:aspartyl-tRNA(Asn)/glutamyl-tRNA(Gln) amidotransferase subunit B
MTQFEAVMGLEIHCQLKTKTKVFCPTAYEFGHAPNTCVGPVSAGLPGALPIFNKEVLELAVRAGLALNCSIRSHSQFARKNYFYPDLPKGYQISQFTEPLCESGFLEMTLDNGQKKHVGIERIHLEEDAGKSDHSPLGTLINLNRAGVPLIEIVSKPDMRSPVEAANYFRKVHSILVALGVCEGNLEQGQLRCDANVSVRPLGSTTLGTRAEIKNLNSFRFLEKAVDFEIARQISVLQSGGRLVQETRGYDAAANKTFHMRFKEDSEDYRYFPDPDLPPLLISKEHIAAIRNSMPVLPEARSAELLSLGVGAFEAEELATNLGAQTVFSKLLNFGVQAKLAATWVVSEFAAKASEKQVAVESLVTDLLPVAELLKAVQGGQVSMRSAKDVFKDAVDLGRSPMDLVLERGLAQIANTQQIEAIIDAVIAANPAQVAEFKSGKTKVFSFFVGQVMKQSGGRAEPQMTADLLRKKLQ